MPTRGKVCVLAGNKREATAWAKQNDVKPNRWTFPYNAERVRGVQFSKVVVLPSFEKVRARHAILKALKATEKRRFAQKPEWVEVTDEETPTGPPIKTLGLLLLPGPEPGFENELPGQTDIFEQIAAHEAVRLKGYSKDPQAPEDGEVSPAGEPDDPDSEAGSADGNTEPELAGAGAGDADTAGTLAAVESQASSGSPEPVGDDPESAPVKPKPKPPKVVKQTKVSGTPTMDDLTALLDN